MSASRAMDQADFDLERFIGMFDEALTSNDPRVVDALRSLMMMIILTKPESEGRANDKTAGPLRGLFNDVTTLSRRLSRLEEEMRTHAKESHREAMQRQWGSYTVGQWRDELDKYRWDQEYSLKDEEILKRLSTKINNIK